jgi:hypothetical protein
VRRIFGRQFSDVLSGYILNRRPDCTILSLGEISSRGQPQWELRQWAAQHGDVPQMMAR